MDLIALAIPFFLLAIALELLLDRYKGTGYYRASDAINSLSAGILSTTFGYFTKLLPVLVWGYVLRNFALIDMPLSWFDASLRGILLWIVAAVAWDFCYYWFHRCSHEVSVLWAAHAVHHQSEDYNLTTALRQTSSGFLFGWIFYLPLFVIGFPFEVLVTVSAVNLIYQFWVHTQLVDRLGIVDRILVTPSNHRVHHAQNAQYIDKNYGGIFILWDRLFGTYAEEDSKEPVIFGVRKPLASWNPFWANLQVYNYLWFDARRTRRWRDKLAIWFRRTGWRPADVATRFPAAAADLKTFRKFDPQPARRVRRYVMAQFVVAIAMTFYIGETVIQSGALAVLGPCLLLWALLATLGYFNEASEIAVKLEAIRLLAFNPIILLLQAVWLTPLRSEAIWLATFYTALSLLGLLLIRTVSAEVLVDEG
tara:strand:- start:545 stop:1810 length:1266 start_codon:yes stop_codon:yes gene_type:complete